MAAAFVGGAALGAVFGEAFAELLHTVKNAGSKVLMFKSILNSLESNLNLLAPVVEDITGLNQKLNRPEAETKNLIENMKKAEELIRTCSEIQGWNIAFQSYYAGKLIELDEAIMKFCQIHMPAQNRRDMLKILTELKSLREEKKSGNSCVVPSPPNFTVGLDVPLKVLKMQLLKEEEQQLLLTAPGGCGKTTLVKRLGHDDEIKGKFKDKIYFVPVSKTLNLMVIVQRLFSHISDQVREFQSDEDAINQLQVLLEQNGSNPILLILDDVLPGSEICLGKLNFNIPNYNILVTSRTTFPGFGFTYNLEPLEYKDAMTLFCHSASLQNVRYHIPVQDIKEIVSRCGGFPRALEENGKLLGVAKHVEVWQSRARSLSNGHSIFKYSSDMLDCLRRSLEFSDHEVIFKECFLDLSLFLKVQMIPVHALIDMWAELYKFDEDGIDAIANLHELNTRNLANLVRTRNDASEVNNYLNDYYNEDYVTQYYLLRELAVFESCQGPEGQRHRLIMDMRGNTLPNWCTEQDQQLIHARLLSISTDESFSSTWCKIQAPKVEVLVLNFRTTHYKLPDFVDKMYKLKVLIITNHGSFPAELINFQLLKSLPNLKRIRLEKVSISPLCKLPVLLRNLKKISLFMCNIGQAFENCTIQASDAFPNLTEINIDYCKNPVKLLAVLCDAILLKKINIFNCSQLFTLSGQTLRPVDLEVSAARARDFRRFESMHLFINWTLLSNKKVRKSMQCLHKFRLLYSRYAQKVGPMLSPRGRGVLVTYQWKNVRIRL